MHHQGERFNSPYIKDFLEIYVNVLIRSNMGRKLSLLLVLCVLAGLYPPGQAKRLPGVNPDKILYKTVDNHKLYLHVFYPKKKSNRPVPAAVFYHAGGWNSGDPEQFYSQAKHLADKGLVGISVEYRIKNKHKSHPFDSVEDAKSAMRFIRKNAGNTNVFKVPIRRNKIAAGGASAGGHLAAATATLSAFNAKSDDTSISTVPNALILFCPGTLAQCFCCWSRRKLRVHSFLDCAVYDNGPRGYAYGRPGIAANYKKFSPLHNISEQMPSTIVFLGTKDVLTPVATAKKFQRLMKQKGVTSELRLYKGQGHGFFNYGKEYDQTLKQMDRFLKRRRYF